MGDYARLIELAYLEAKNPDLAGQSYWCRLLRTHPNGPDFVVAECRRQLKLAPIAS